MKLHHLARRPCGLAWLVGAALSVTACGDSSSSSKGTASTPTPSSSDQGGDTPVTPEWYAHIVVIKHVVGGTATAGDFTITVNNPGANPGSFHGSEGGTSVTVTAGAYSVVEQEAAGYEASYSEDCTGTIAVGESKTCVITNTVIHKLCGHKFYDADGDGVFDEGESTLAGWRIDLIRDGTTVTINTDENGRYMFWDVAEGDYEICEGMPVETNWVQTAPADGCHRVHVPVDDECACNLDFGNVCNGPGPGRTPGFWSNQNGEEIFDDEDGGAAAILLLQGLPLKDADGKDFDPEDYGSFRTWLLEGDAVNMAYKLSVHLAAMELNVWAGIVSPDALVYVPDGYLGISDLMAAAIEALVEDGYTPDGDANRAYQAALKNALDAANNGRGYAQESACAYTWPE